MPSPPPASLLEKSRGSAVEECRPNGLPQMSDANVARNMCEERGNCVRLFVPTKTTKHDFWHAQHETNAIKDMCDGEFNKRNTPTFLNYYY